MDQEHQHQEPSTYEEYQQEYNRQVEARQERDAEDIRRLRAEAAEFIDQFMKAEADKNEATHQARVKSQAELYEELSINDKVPQWKRICEVADVANPPEGVDTSRMAGVMRGLINGVQETLKTVPLSVPLRAAAGEPEPKPESPKQIMASPWDDVISPSSPKQDENNGISPIQPVSSAPNPFDDILRGPETNTNAQPNQASQHSLMSDLFGDISPSTASTTQEQVQEPLQVEEQNSNPFGSPENGLSNVFSDQMQPSPEGENERMQEQASDSSFSGEVIDSSSENKPIAQSPEEDQFPQIITSPEQEAVYTPPDEEEEREQEQDNDVNDVTNSNNNNDDGDADQHETGADFDF